MFVIHKRFRASMHALKETVENRRRKS